MRYDSPGFRIFVGVIVVAVSATAVAGLWISGSPAAERARRLDDRRIQDLQTISNAIDSYYTQNKEQLPPSLDTLTGARDAYYVSSIKDPDTMRPYEYQQDSSSTYRLCATFTTDTRSEGQTPDIYSPYPSSTFWQHGPERTCFAITARNYNSPTPK